MLELELAAASYVKEITEGEKINTIYYPLFESGELDTDILESEEVMANKYLLDHFAAFMKDYIEENIIEFIGENLEETVEKITGFTAVATKQFLNEIAEFDEIANMIEESVASEEEMMEAEAIFEEMLDRAYFNALSAGYGALSIL